MSCLSWEWALPNDTTAPGQGRQLLREALGSDPRIDDAELVASELLTNAVVHGEPPVVLRVEARPEAIRVEVFDAGTGHDYSRTIQPPAPDDPRGRGLVLVALVARDYGGHMSDYGWVSWAEIGTSSASISDS